MGDLGSIPGLGKSPGEEKGYLSLENSTDCIVHGIAKSRTRLSDFHFHSPLWEDSEEGVGSVGNAFHFDLLS